MLFGLQLYGFSNEFKKDPEAFCQRISEGGIRFVEPCLTFIDALTEYGFWSLEYLEGNLPLFEKYGLGVSSVHVATADWDASLPPLIALAEKTGLKAVVVKAPPELTEESLARAAAVYKDVAAKLAPHGIALLLHNEAREIETKIVCSGAGSGADSAGTATGAGGSGAAGSGAGGKTALETLLDLCGGAVQAQVDVGWVYAGGEDPEVFLWQNEGRVASIHYKDMSPAKAEVAPGTGTVDFTACFQFARAHGCTQIIDMDKGSVEEAAAGVRKLAALVQVRDNTSSFLYTLNVDTGEEVLLHRFDGEVMEAPNWLNDGRTILYNAHGCIFKYDIETDSVTKVDTDFCTSCNNDHVPSADNTRLAVSCTPPDSRAFLSNIYIIDLVNGGVPELVTPDGLSFLHGWSPDGKTLAYCGFKSDGAGADGDAGGSSGAGGQFPVFHAEICTRDIDTRAETVLTHNAAFNDSPEYSPDGRHIWFISTRSGLMQVWRMDADGSNPVQMTDSDANNWFGHVSPDGKRVVYLAFAKGELEPHEHLPNMRVALYLMNYDGSEKRKLLDFFGGQGSINVNSWAPDSKRIAFVKYELHHK